MPTAIYVRKSSESDDRQTQSIDDQLNRLTALAAREGLAVAHVFAESKSAKEPGARLEFARMIDLIHAGEIDSLLTWSMDRLSRNMVDGGMVAHLLQGGRLKFIRTLERTYLPGDNAVIIAVENGMSTNYLQNLSRDVKRGLRGKVERGGCPRRAPIGYVNNLATHEIDPDPERYELIRKGWHLLLRERMNPAQILRALSQEGLTTNTKRGPNSDLSKSLLYSVFRNPFYSGWITFHGELFRGTHQPMITDLEFEVAQRRLKFCRKHRVMSGEYAYSGVFRCGVCRCSVVGETKSSKTSPPRFYEYYHCSGVKGCRRISVSDQRITDSVKVVADRIKLPSSIVQHIETHISQSTMYLAGETEETADRLSRRLTTAENRLRSAQIMRIDGELGAEDFATLKESLVTEVLDCKRRIERQHTARERVRALVHEKLHVCETAHGYEDFAVAVKRAFLLRLGEGHTLTNRNIRLGIHPILKTVLGFEMPQTSSGSRDEPPFLSDDSIWLDLANRIGKVAWKQVLRELSGDGEAEIGGVYVPPERGRPYRRNRIQSALLTRRFGDFDALDFERRRLGDTGRP